MNKTLHKTFSKHNANIHTLSTDAAHCNEDLTELTGKMRGIIQQAADDLIQPRPELVENLLKKLDMAKQEK